MKKIIKCFVLVLLLIIISVNLNVSAINNDSYFGIQPILDNTILSNNNINLRYASASSDLAVDITQGNIDNLKSLEEGTIIARFKSQSTTIQSLIGVSNGDKGQQNSYFHLYVTDKSVGFEIRKSSGGDIAKFSTPAKISRNEVHTVAFKADKTFGYKVFLDGEIILEVPISELTYGYGFLNNIPNLNKAYIGKTYRSTAINGYPFIGDINYITVSSGVVDDSKLKEYTQTPHLITSSNRSKIFDKLENGTGTLNSNSFRIPSMIRTDNNIIISMADIRYGNSDDSPNNIDIGMRRSLDNGVTWEDPKLVLNFQDYPNVATSKISNSASFIDSILVKGDNNRIFLICDAFRGGSGQPNCIESSGFIELEGKRYLVLYDSNGELYTVRENKEIFNSKGVKTNYLLGNQFALLENGVEVSNIFYASSPLKVESTSFLISTYSDDDGLTWSDPTILNGQVKSDNMRFFGVGPGIGIQLKNSEEYNGRLVVPVYFDSNNTKGSYRGIMIYSDDNGATWNCGEPTPVWKPNDGILPEEAVFYEIQMVEMPDGQIKMFSRTSKRGKVIVATSFDGGVTWENPYMEDELIMSNTSGCQLSVINYSKPINGYPAVIFSNPASNTRSNGTIRVGLIKEDGIESNGRNKYVFDWISSKVVKTGEFAYSSLVELSNGNIGLLCEEDKDAGQLDYLAYTEFNINYLVPVNINIESGIMYKNINNLEEVLVSIKFDRSIEIFGEQKILLNINNDIIEGIYLGKNSTEDTLYFSVGVNKLPSNLEGVKCSFDSLKTEIYGVLGEYVNLNEINLDITGINN